MAYKDFKKMYNDYVNSIKNACIDVIPPIMEEKHKEAIVIEVYSAYQPTYGDENRRFGDNGFLDDNNIEFDVKVNKNKIIITLYNETKGNPYLPNNQSNMFIDEIIVTGEGYSWKNSEIAKNKLKRDFYEATEKLMNSDEVRKKIIKELNKRGFKVW